MYRILGMASFCFFFFIYFFFITLCRAVEDCSILNHLITCFNMQKAVSMHFTGSKGERMQWFANTIKPVKW